ncbi:uncharacterized protein BT62DRAFT_1075904 [Guyanagaster necrorhizus]|uniref:Proteasome assembly chaperone 2 n=1 Tax=Guyanagaster necrorhizus TaxID=856835 RepID=A0A9P7VTK8_9AGAR|nr:uncharacterized protein BT62DRAFT_1075904 [Guyanagaster necrorhizus MCA 3950]KAG7446322.1 hypothetical protein BT62DRAFT_1075904 [Guyanagaster necrorhizus MCA 3950]
MSFYKPTVNANLNKTLIVPIVSTANVSQLAADLLIASLSLHSLGAFDPSFFIPAVGGKEDGDDGISTPFELYGRDDVDLLVLQQRSPTLKSRKQEFVDALLNFFIEYRVSSVILLSGVDLSNRTDAQMMTPIYYIQPQNTPSFSFRDLRIPKYSSPVPQWPQDENDEPDIPFIPGGGLTRRTLASLPREWIIPTVALLQFVLEGDNRADAHMLAIVATKVAGIESHIGELKQPSSWNQGLFGTPHDQTLYG